MGLSYQVGRGGKATARNRDMGVICKKEIVLKEWLRSPARDVQKQRRETISNPWESTFGT